MPKSEMPNEQTWPTQPFPTNPPPFGRQSFTEKDISPYIEDPAERGQVSRPTFAPRATRGCSRRSGTSGYAMQIPGNNGGANFGGAAVDPARGMVFVVNKDWPALLKLNPAPPANPPEPADPSGLRYRSAFGFMITTQRPAGDRAAVEHAHGVRPERSARSSGRFRSATSKSSPRRASRTRAVTSRRWDRWPPPAGSCSPARATVRFVRSTSRPARCSGRGKRPTGIEGIPAVYEVNGKPVHRLLRGGDTGPSHTRAVLPAADAGDTAGRRPRGRRRRTCGERADSRSVRGVRVADVGAVRLSFSGNRLGGLKPATPIPSRSDLRRRGSRLIRPFSDVTSRARPAPPWWRRRDRRRCAGPSARRTAPCTPSLSRS